MPIVPETQLFESIYPHLSRKQTSRDLRVFWVKFWTQISICVKKWTLCNSANSKNYQNFLNSQKTKWSNCHQIAKFVKSPKNCKKLSKFFLSKWSSNVIVVKHYQNCQQLSKCWSGHVLLSLWSNVLLLYWYRFLLHWTKFSILKTHKLTNNVFHELSEQSLPPQVVYKPWLI